jgi:hypothetical protein
LFIRFHDNNPEQTPKTFYTEKTLNILFHPVKIKKSKQLKQPLDDELLLEALSKKQSNLRYFPYLIRLVQKTSPSNSLYSFSEIRISFHQGKIVAFLVDREGDDLFYQGTSFLSLKESIIKQVAAMQKSGWDYRKRDEEVNLEEKIRGHFRLLLSK